MELILLDPLKPDELLSAEVTLLCEEITGIFSDFRQSINSALLPKVSETIEHDFAKRKINPQELFYWSPLVEHSSRYQLHDSDKLLQRDMYRKFELSSHYASLGTLKGEFCFQKCKSVFSPHNSHEYRTTEIRSTRDRTGNKVRFQAQYKNARYIRELQELIDGSQTLDPVFKAIYVLYVFLVIHPFGDGNGRTSRGLFNHILVREGVCDVPLVPVGLYKLKSDFLFETLWKLSILEGEPGFVEFVKYFYTIIWDLQNHEFLALTNAQYVP